MWTAVVIFSATYVLIAARRLTFLPIGRPAGALLGATAMVGLGVLTPEQAYAAIDMDTIVLLFAMMLLTAGLDEDTFARLAAALVARVRTPHRLLAAVSVLAAVASALLVNDTVCLLLAGPLARLCATYRLPTGAFLIALATSANIGSAATLVGNPQNMLIGSMSGIAFATFSSRMLPVAVVALAANIALLLWMYHGPLRASSLHAGALPPASAARGTAGSRVVAVVLLLVLLAFLAGAHLGFAALAGAMVVVVLSGTEPRELFARIDWTLLVFFCALFVVVGGLASTGLVHDSWAAMGDRVTLDTPGGVALVTLGVAAGSNLISNVPLVMLIGEQVGQLGQAGMGWYLLAWTSTVAGNLTLLGSVANIVVAERAREHYALGFFEYLRFGLPATVAVTAVGLLLLFALG